MLYRRCMQLYRIQIEKTDVVCNYIKSTLKKTDVACNVSTTCMDKYQNKFRISSARLKNYDYTNNGFYFITICTKERKHFFGQVTNDVMILNELGKITESCWSDIPKHSKLISLGEYIVMPNHVHGILIIDNTIETMYGTSAVPNIAPVTKNQMSAISPKANSISSAVRSFKSAVTRATRNKRPEFNWQVRFHDHIIRNYESYLKISDYIRSNPSNWKKDIFYDEI
ncbi:transposase [soil metagenome]